jgi:ComF family protein
MLEKIIAVFAPYVCLGCGVEENMLLCEGCRHALPSLPSRCYRCHAITRDFTVCKGCSRTSSLSHVQVVTSYDGLAKELLHRAKYERAQTGLHEIAEQMCEAHETYVEPGVTLVPLPTATSRVRQRGYDHAVLLAKDLSRLLGAPMSQLLRRTTQTHQVGSSRAVRLKHMEGAFRVTQLSRMKDAHILLIDDVTTTGATLESAAKVCRQHGARRVDALVYAQAL